MDEAYEECGFEVDNNAQLMIEAFPLTSESILITITKVDSGFREDLERELSHLSSKILADIDEEDLQTADDVIYKFTNLEDVIELAGTLGENEIASVLYRFDERYYLYLPDTPPADSVIYGALDEYGVEIGLAHEFLAEHGEVMIAENALRILSKI